jgi:outer membrane biogenesis lipoprotein LolB
MLMTLLLSKEETILQSMVDKLIGMEINVEELRQWEFQGNQPHYRLR